MHERSESFVLKVPEVLKPTIIPASVDPEGQLAFTAWPLPHRAVQATRPKQASVSAVHQVYEHLQ